MTGANVAGPVATLVTAPVLARTLGVVGRGEVAAVTAPYLLVTAVAAFGIPEAITHFVARRELTPVDAIRTSLRFVVVSGAAVMLALIGGATWLSDGDPHLERLITVGAVAIVPTLLLGLLRGAAAGMHLWSSIARERSLTAALRLLVVVLLAISGELTVTTASLTIIFTPLVGALSYVGLHRLGRSRPQDQAVPLVEPGIISYGFRLWVGVVSGVLLFRLDQALIVPLSDAGELGIYAVAATVSEVPLITTRAMRDVTFAADAAGGTDERLATTARLSGVAALTIGAALSLSLPFWITAVFGAGFRSALPVAWILTAAVVLGAPGSIMGAALSARGRPGLRSTALVAALGVNILLLVVLVPRFGAMGAAVATLFGNVTANTLVAAFMWKVLGLSPRPFVGARGRDLQLLSDFAYRGAESLLARARKNRADT